MIILGLLLTLSLLISISFQAPMTDASQYNISSPKLDNLTVTWDCIYFGNYWQNDTNGDGVSDQNDYKEPIKWRVLSVNGKDAFLMADQNLDCQPYHDPSYADYLTWVWDICTLRNWLNGYDSSNEECGSDYSSDNFIDAAFSKTEQNAIQTTEVINENHPIYGTESGNDTKDKVYLLSIDEATNMNYGFKSTTDSSETRYAKNTAYAEIQGAKTYNDETCNGNGDWWLRSPGSMVGGVSVVSYNGNIDTGACIAPYHYYVGVRPVLHLNLSDTSVWSYAGTVSSDGTENLIAPPPTAVPIPTATQTITPTATAIPTVSPTDPPVYTKPPIPTTAARIVAITPTPSPTPVKAPSKPTIKSAKNNKKKTVTLSWKKVKNAKGYDVQYATNEAFSKKSKLTKSTKVVIKKLKKKKTYSFRVRAYALDGKTKVYSKWSKVKRVKIKK